MIYLYGYYYQSNSYGINCNYELINILNRNGYSSKLFCCEPSSLYTHQIPDAYKSFFVPNEKLPEDIKKDDIIILLDTCPKNPFASGHIVHWLLNKPMFLTGDSIHYEDDEIVVSYSKLIRNDLPQLFILKDEIEFFDELRSNAVHRKDTVSVYFGKVHLEVLRNKFDLLKQIITEYSTVNLITRQSPNDRKAALKSIADSDLLVSFDPLTNLNYEATLLGTPVLMMDDAYDTQNNVFNVLHKGVVYDPSELLTSRNCIDSVYDNYIAWINKQDDAVVSLFKWILNRFNLMESNDSVLNENKQLNSEIQKQDVEEYDYYIKCKPFVGINIPEELPLRIIRLFHIKISIKAFVTARIKRIVIHVSRKLKVFDKTKHLWIEFKLRMNNRCNN